jgi:hypothetical protein
MSEASGHRFGIVVVTSAQPGDNALQILFRDGSIALLLPDHPDYGSFLHLVEWSLEFGRPVGVVIDASDCVVDMNQTYESHVRWVESDAQRTDRVEVALWAFSPVTYLTRDHPEFRRLYATLVEAAASRGRVWFANRSEMVEGESETWHKIMDVCPVDAVIGAFEPLRIRTGSGNGAGADGPAGKGVSGEVAPTQG